MNRSGARFGRQRLAPASMKADTIATPMPRLPPKTSTFFPEKSLNLGSLRIG
jgi:hypothetical protein